MMFSNQADEENDRNETREDVFKSPGGCKRRTTRSTRTQRAWYDEPYCIHLFGLGVGGDI